jgi:AcrR family transcriptional regulator
MVHFTGIDMAQVLKRELYDRLLAAAVQVFAAEGYQGATMATIAQRAGISAGNVYRYFENKEALFSEILTDDFVDRFRRLLKRRVAALLEAPDLTALDADARQKADELLRFWIEQRLKVVILLDRAEGSRFSDFGAEFVNLLLGTATAKLRQQTRCRSLSAPDALVLSSIFQNTRRSIVSILERFTEESEIREAFAAFWSYQLAGLAGFRKWVMS